MTKGHLCMTRDVYLNWTLTQCKPVLSGADLGFYKGGCPIHLKGGPEVGCQRHRGGWVWGRVWAGGCALSPENFCISYIKMVSFFA